MADAPPRKRRRLRPGERRALIVDAAGRLFGERGFDGTRLDQVAAAAGVTKPILYRHFRDKTALYLGVLERHRDDLDSFAAAIPPDATPEQQLRAVLEVWLAYVDEHAYAWKMLFRDNGGGTEVQAFRAEVQSRARAVLAGLIKTLSEQPIPAGEVQALAELIRAGMASLALRSVDHAAPDRASVINAILRVWSGVLRAPADGARGDHR